MSELKYSMYVQIQICFMLEQTSKIIEGSMTEIEKVNKGPNITHSSLLYSTTCDLFTKLHSYA